MGQAHQRAKGQGEITGGVRDWRRGKHIVYFLARDGLTVCSCKTSSRIHLQIRSRIQPRQPRSQQSLLLPMRRKKAMPRGKSDIEIARQA